MRALIDRQLLVPALAPPMTGAAPLAGLAAQLAGHPAQAALEQPLCHYIGDGPEAAERARWHFYALRELCPSLRGVALYSHPGPQDRMKDAGASALHEHTWQRGDLDSYYALDEVLLAFAHNERGVASEAATAVSAIEQVRWCQAAAAMPERATGSDVRSFMFISSG